jgi:hypothetical protein
LELIKLTNKNEFHENSDTLRDIVHSISQELYSDYRIEKSSESELSFILDDIERRKLKIILRISDEEEKAVNAFSIGS